MQRSLAAIVGIAGFLILLIVAALWSVPAMEDDLTARANDELARADIEQVDVSFSGRDGSLTGPFAEEAEESLGTLRGARSVGVDDRPDVAGLNASTAAAAAAAADDSADVGNADRRERPEVTMTRNGRTAVFAGIVGSEDDRVRLAGEARSAGFDVDDQLSVDTDLRRNEDTDAARRLVRPLLIGSDDGEFTLENGIVLIRATAADPVESEAIALAASEAEAAGLAVERDLKVVELSEDEQVVALQSSIDQIFELAKAIEIESPNFGTRQRDLNESAVNILDRVAIELRRYPLPSVEVVGHADSRGSDETNQRLSEERAAAVAGYLVSGGVDAERMESSGRGENEPVASNGDEIGRLENRRVNFVVRKVEG